MFNVQSFLNYFSYVLNPVSVLTEVPPMAAALRKRGRPRGSKNKPKISWRPSCPQPESQRGWGRGRGRVQGGQFLVGERTVVKNLVDDEDVERYDCVLCFDSDSITIFRDLLRRRRRSPLSTALSSIVKINLINFSLFSLTIDISSSKFI